MAEVRIKGAENDQVVKVKDEALIVNSLTYPPKLPNRIRPYRAYLKNSSDSNDMGVDGSVTNQEFFITADTDNDVYIRELNVVIGYGTASQLNKFADVTALTNGVELYFDDRFGKQVIHDGLKANSDFIRLANASVFSGSWESRHLGATNDYGMLLTIDLSRFSPGLGIKLDAGTNEKLAMVIRDNCNDADTFNVIAHGFVRY